MNDRTGTASRSSKKTTGEPDRRPSRVVIENVAPQIDGGRFPAKRIPGDTVEVTADIHCDGHDVLAAVLCHRRSGERDWRESGMEPLTNDRWRGSFTIDGLQDYEFTLQAWVDHFRTWKRDLAKRLEAGQEVSVELQIGAELVEQAGRRAAKEDAAALARWAAELRDLQGSDRQAIEKAVLDPARSRVAARWADRSHGLRFDKVLAVTVEREKARFGAWYEMFPRSASSKPGRHGTFKDVEARLPYVAGMGFDVLYLPPIHPIGTTYRKGRNNVVDAKRDDPGSPWAIGSAEGGHKAIHPALGTLKDFRRLVASAGDAGIEIALDIAFQCSPDHPWVKEHPEWFRHRPDGSIQYAENPPKKYQDIYPLDFECEGWRSLWEELKSVVTFWIEQGVRIFRVDNPHTKPYRFWEWLIGGVRREHPDTIFLAEAFTRPKVMYQLAKLGFSQSYNYFAWRNASWEIREYFEELTRPPVSDFFRPNLWPNTPDILTEYLQAGGRPACLSRLVLAATLGASYGIYGPAFELCDNRPLNPGKEEYLDSEKYQIRHWDITRSDSLRDVIARVNRIRRDNPCLHRDRSLQFHPVTNDQLVAYSKHSDDMTNLLVMVVNLDPHHTHSGFVNLPLRGLGIDEGQPFQVHDLLSDARFIWNGPSNYVELDPHTMPAHILRVRRRLRTERDFDYYL